MKTVDMILVSFGLFVVVVLGTATISAFSAMATKYERAISR